MRTFAAIDFETANYSPDSACAIGVVVAQHGKIVHRVHHLIRPPYKSFAFTHIHGITWNDVRKAPSFDEVWSEIREELDGIGFFAAHNAAFDRRVLNACCARYEVRPPAEPYVCTVQLARRTWGLSSARLPIVCKHLGISLRHHDAGSDAEACARIVLAAQESGWTQ